MRTFRSVRSLSGRLAALRPRSLVLSMAAIAAFAGPAAAVSPLEPSFQLSSAAPSCAASVSIFEAVQPSANIRIGFSWQTIGASSVSATVRLFPHGSGTAVYTSTFAVSPPASGSAYHLIGPQGFPSGLYRVRVNLSTNCLASAQSETFMYYTAP